jgi:predicted RNase H-like HicB family nuclease
VEYLAVLEQGATGWGAHVPDLPIVLATGATREEVERRVREAVKLYLEELADRGEQPPAPTTQGVMVGA